MRREPRQAVPQDPWAGEDLLKGACSMMGKIPVLLGPGGPGTIGIA